MGKPLVSVIVIDYKRNNAYLQECLDALRLQKFTNFEIILESDYENPIKAPKLKVVSYGGKYIPPAIKRDHAGKISLGQILAFIDDDAFPDPDWLKNMVSDFDDPQVVAVGGPGITPPRTRWQETASGWASASPIGAGPYTYRFLPGKKQYVDDYPSMNLAVRKKDFQAVNGFDSHYWPGEDTKLCLDLVHKLKKKILYDPGVIVYHHRRPLWRAHLRQNGNFGLHRGFFARILPETSFRPVYFAPSFMDLGLVYLIFFPHLNSFVTNLGLLALFVYLLGLLANGLWILKKSRSLFQAAISLPAVFITHVWYGLRFLQGFFFTKKLSR